MQGLEKKNIHIISIGGSIMHDLAINLKKSGNNISGSDDIIYNPSKSRLKKNGILPKKIGYFKNNINNNAASCLAVVISFMPNQALKIPVVKVGIAKCSTAPKSEIVSIATIISPAIIAGLASGRASRRKVSFFDK